MSSKQWLSRVYHLLTKDTRPLECVQQPGEIMYVPAAWAHLTSNQGEAVGIGAQVTWDPSTDRALLNEAAVAGDPEASFTLGYLASGNLPLLKYAADWHPLAIKEKFFYVRRLVDHVLANRNEDKHAVEDVTEVVRVFALLPTGLQGAALESLITPRLLREAVHRAQQIVCLRSKFICTVFEARQGETFKSKFDSICYQLNGLLTIDAGKSLGQRDMVVCTHPNNQLCAGDQAKLRRRRRPNRKQVQLQHASKQIRTYTSIYIIRIYRCSFSPWQESA
jgi:hypothetical protein